MLHALKKIDPGSRLKLEIKLLLMNSYFKYLHIRSTSVIVCDLSGIVYIYNMPIYI